MEQQLFNNQTLDEFLNYPINNSSDPLQNDHRGFSLQQPMNLVGETLIDGWENQGDAKQALVYVAASIFNANFAVNAGIAFGESFDVQKAQALGDDILTGESGILPDVKFLSNAEMKGALGAYAESINTIAINSDFVINNAGNPGVIGKVVIEEIGHFLDAYANPVDSVGDEGDILAGLVAGKSFSASELAVLKAEDDSSVIIIDGESVSVELASSQTDILLGNKVDFDGDGKTDFIRQEKGHFASDRYGMFQTYLSNGNGSFRQAWDISDPSRGMNGDWTNLFMGDFNGDGKTDFLRQEKGHLASKHDWMFETFISNGDGSFTSKFVMHENAMHGDLTNLFIGDFNGDGYSDFIRQEKGHFASDRYGMFQTYLSNGDGSFRKAWEISDPSRGMNGDWTNLFMGDFNGDGRTDFIRQEKSVLASKHDWMFETFISNGDGSFTSKFVMHDAAMNGDLTNLFIGDFNGDGRSDFIRQEKGSLATDNGRMFETYLSNGDGSFRKAWDISDHTRGMNGDWTNLLLGDFNGDGKTDFIRQEKDILASKRDWMFETFISNGDGSFTSKFVMHENAMHGDLTNLFVGDFDGNGSADFLRQEKGHFANDVYGMLQSYTSNGDGSFTKRWQVDKNAMHGDLTNLFTNNIKPPHETSPTDILLGNQVDFDGDGKTDFIRQEKGHFADDRYGMFQTYLSNGNGSFRQAWDISDPSRGMNGDWTNLFMGDFNGDGKTDFIRQEKGHLASKHDWMFETFISNGDGSFTSKFVMHENAMHGDLTNLFIGDFNGDGRSDFIRQEKGHFANDRYGMFQTYLSNGDGSFRKAWEISDSSRGMNGDWTNLFMGDFNGDGKTDFIRQEKGHLASKRDWMFETFISNGDGSFTSKFVMHENAMHGDLTNLFVGDFNGDGYSDFIRQEKGHFATDRYGMFQTYLSNGDGSFRKAWEISDPSRGMNGDWTNLFLGDFNGDGKTDFIRQEKSILAVKRDWMFETFISNGDGSFTSKFVIHENAMNGDLTNLFVGDFDGNGRDDFLRQEKGHFASDIYGMLQSYTSNGNGSFTKRWQVDKHAMHGDLTNLFTNNMGGANDDGIIMRKDENSEAYYIYGDILRAYRENNSVAGLGYPTSNVFNDGHGNIAQNFGYNRITLQANGETFVGGYVNGVRLDGDFYRVWNQYKLGTPESDVHHYNGITYRYFNHPVLGKASAVQSQYGTHPLWGGIRHYYVNVAGGLGGVLGAPKSGEYRWNGNTRQDFANGYVLWNGSSVGYKYDGSLLFSPPSSGSGSNSGSSSNSGSGSGSRTGYEQYLYLLYRDNIGNRITQNYEQHGNAIDSVDGDGDRRLYALAGGQIRYIGKDHYGGNYIQIWNSHLKRNFFYVHFASFNSNLKIGQNIGQGEWLGIEGSTGKSTGIHTHVHVTKADRTRENPLVTLGLTTNNESSGVSNFDEKYDNSGSNNITQPMIGKEVQFSWERSFNFSINTGIYLIEGFNTIEADLNISFFGDKNVVYSIDSLENSNLKIQHSVIDNVFKIGTQLSLEEPGIFVELGNFTFDKIPENRIDGNFYTGIIKIESPKIKFVDFGSNQNNLDISGDISGKYILEARYHRRLLGPVEHKIADFVNIVVSSGEVVEDAIKVLLEENPEIETWAKNAAGVAGRALAIVGIAAIVTYTLANNFTLIGFLDDAPSFAIVAKLFQFVLTGQFA